MRAEGPGQSHCKATPRRALKGHDYQGRFKQTVTSLFNISPVFKKDKENTENQRPVHLNSVFWKVMDQIILETISKHVKNRKGWEIGSMYL